jgi:SAM-dependent methyltransferase
VGGAPCPLCGGNTYAPVIARACDRVTRKAGVFAVERCCQCGLVATRPQPDEATLSRHYHDMYSGRGGEVSSLWQTGGLADWVSRRRAATVRRHAARAPAGRIADIGCGYGGVLAALDDAGFQSLTGVDIDAGSIQGALRRDRIDYRVGTVESLAAEQPGAYSVVTLFQSLEHLRDPVRALRAVHGLLAPGGVCIVEVPDVRGAWRHVFGSWWVPLLVPQHLFHFTPRTLRSCLEAAGFQVLHAKSSFYPFESTFSLGLWLNETLGRPLRNFRLRPARPDGYVVAAVLAAWWLLVEVPSQALLVLLRRSGHQLMIASKPRIRGGDEK